MKSRTTGVEMYDSSSCDSRGTCLVLEDSVWVAAAVEPDSAALMIEIISVQLRAVSTRSSSCRGSCTTSGKTRHQEGNRRHR